MIWIASAEDQGLRSPGSSLLGVDDGFEEFQVVAKKKYKGKAKAKESRIELGTGLLPPSSPFPSDLSLLVTVYEPATFAKHVSLPPSLLPLLGALIGNDYASFEFFRTTESVVQRVQRVADRGHAAGEADRRLCIFEHAHLLFQHGERWIGVP